YKSEPMPQWYLEETDFIVPITDLDYALSALSLGNTAESGQQSETGSETGQVVQRKDGLWLSGKDKGKARADQTSQAGTVVFKAPRSPQTQLPDTGQTPDPSQTVPSQTATGRLDISFLLSDNPVPTEYTNEAPTNTPLPSTEDSTSQQT